MEKPRLMEWGLRKVLPNVTEQQRRAFALHIVPVIIELCKPSIPEEEFEDLLNQIVQAYHEDTPEETEDTVKDEGD